MEKYKKTTLIFLAFSMIFSLIACENDQPQNPPEEKKYQTMEINELSLQIKIPAEYEVKTNLEQNRRGSYLSYDLMKKGYWPILREIHFFSEESIKEFNEKCETSKITPCFPGDFPDVERYRGQKEAFYNNENYENYELAEFKGRKYFVSTFEYEPEFCIIKEYTTFIDDTKVDIWMGMDFITESEYSDLLFQDFEIITQ